MQRKRKTKLYGSMETKDMKGRKGNTTNRSCSRFADKQKVKTQKNSEVLKVKTQKNAGSQWKYKHARSK